MNIPYPLQCLFITLRIGRNGLKIFICRLNGLGCSDLAQHDILCASPENELHIFPFFMSVLFSFRIGDGDGFAPLIETLPACDTDARIEDLLPLPTSSAPAQLQIKSEVDEHRGFLISPHGLRQQGSLHDLVIKENDGESSVDGSRGRVSIQSISSHEELIDGVNDLLSARNDAPTSAITVECSFGGKLKAF